MACDDSLKGCMRSSHVHHGLTLASAAPQVASALAHLGAVNPPSSVDDAYALVGSKGAATPLAEARTACCDNPQPVCKTCDDTQATVTMYVACGERAEHAASALSEVPPSAARTRIPGCNPVHPGCRTCVPRLQAISVGKAATLCARVRSRPRVRPTSCPKRTSSLWATSTARRPPWCRPRRLLWPAPPGRWPRCRPRTWTCLTRHATPRSRQPMATAWARASHRRLEQTCSPMRTRLQPCVRTRSQTHPNLRRAPCDGRRSQHVLDVHWCPRRRPHSRPGH